MSIQALREARAAKAKEIDALVKKETWNEAVDQPIYDAGMAEIDRIDAQIKRINDFNASVARGALDSQIDEAAGKLERDKGEIGKLHAKWLRGGDRAISAEEWAVIRNVQGAMSTTSGAEGGYTVQTEVAKVVLDALKAYGGMREVATVIQTEQGNPINYPNSDGTNEEGEIVAENASASDGDISFGFTMLTPYKYSSKVVPVPIELLQDSAIDVEAFVNQRIVNRLGRVTNRHFTAGDGVSKPKGAAIAAPVGVTAANGTSQVTSITYDSLVDLQHSVDIEYRKTGNCRFMFHDLTMRQIRKIKDAEGRPIFVPGYETGSPGGAPDRVLNDPIQINNHMPAMAASARSIVYGDFSSYMIRDVLSVLLQRFDDSAYAKKGQVGFLGWIRSGGAYVDVGGALKVFVNAAS
ncbi:MAG: phage major capsid protein [Proteobacteria bacterium]|nr:phage major capsid protein [Pseudomonadota bacterium]